jgi:hypothetical protein
MRTEVLGCSAPRWVKQPPVHSHSEAASSLKFRFLPLEGTASMHYGLPATAVLLLDAIRKMVEHLDNFKP